MTVIVLCLEGCHGSGKTALTKYFRDMGFAVMDEGFLSQPPTLLHPQSLLMETVWVCGWFQRLMSHVVALQRSADEAHRIVIADRSPLSAVFYSRSDGGLLEPLIRQYVKELKEVADVHIHTVHLRTERELLWNRIQQRLAMEPERAALREDKPEWMDAVLAFYDSMSWDVTVSNNIVDMPQLASETLTNLAQQSTAVATAASAVCPQLLQTSDAAPSLCSASSDADMTLSECSDDVCSDDDARVSKRASSSAVHHQMAAGIITPVKGGSSESLDRLLPGAIHLSPGGETALVLPMSNGKGACVITMDEDSTGSPLSMAMQ